MFFLLLYLTLVTLAMGFLPEWSTAAALLVPLAVVLMVRVALALTSPKQKTPGDSGTGG